MQDWKSEIEAAAARIEPHVVRTPVVELDSFDLGYPVEMKLEQLQHTGTFKARGAFNTLLSADVPDGGVVAASGGFVLLWLYGQPWFLAFPLVGDGLRELLQVGTVNLSVAVWVGVIALVGIAVDDGVVDEGRA